MVHTLSMIHNLYTTGIYFSYIMIFATRTVRSYPPPTIFSLLLAVILAICLSAVWLPTIANASEDIHDVTGATEKLVTPDDIEEIVPPLPNFRPQVGPVIKHGYPYDVNRWTTAFIPKSLDNLTPIEMPTSEDRWIRVDLSEQVVIAYEGDRPIRGFVISSGLPRTPTVTGTFRIRAKVSSQNMSGGDRASDNYYDLDNVQWVQYFFEDYSFHGTYWHNDFGIPRSHGCLNMTITDAKWLFDWAGPAWDGYTTWYHSSVDNPGTLVIVHE